MYKTINNLRNFKKNKRFIRDNNGSLITADKDIVKKQGKYFEELLNL